MLPRGGLARHTAAAVGDTITRRLHAQVRNDRPTLRRRSLKVLVAKFRGEGMRAHLLRAVFGSGSMKAAQALFALAITVVLARVLGPKGYGEYSLAFSWMALIAIPAQIGLPTLVVREVAKYQITGRWDMLRGLLRWSNWTALFISLGIGLMSGICSWVLLSETRPDLEKTFLSALLLVPIIALGNLRGAVLRGLRFIVYGQIPEMVLRPGFLLLLLLGATAWIGDITPQIAMSLHVIAGLAAFILGAMFLMLVLPPEARQVKPNFETVFWIRSLVPLTLLAGMQVVNAQIGIVMLGWFGSNEQVGIYRVAVQGAYLVAFSLVVVNMALAPNISRLHAIQDREKLQQLTTISARLVFAMALPICLVLMIFGGYILTLLFGSGYEAAHVAFAILCLGHLINAGLGSVDMLLNMTGNEGATTRGFTIATMTNLGLGLLLIPRFDITGAAVAASCSVVVWSGLLYIQVYRKLGVKSGIL